jgi:ATP-dependent protease HslVU (ClpYQ) peptidase subunit
MTTVAANKSEMACDLQGTMGQQQKMKMDTKIHHIPQNDLIYPDGEFLLGLAGQADICIELADFFKYPETYERAPRIRQGDIIGLILTDKGHLFTFTNPAKWLAIKDPFFAIGSGALTALGALHAGASPRDAVKAAMKIDPFTGMGTKVLKL